MATGVPGKAASLSLTSGSKMAWVRSTWGPQEKPVSEPRNRWKRSIKGSVLTSSHEGSGNTRQRRCLSHEGSGTHRAQAVFLATNGSANTRQGRCLSHESSGKKRQRQCRKGGLHPVERTVLAVAGHVRPEETVDLGQRRRVPPATGRLDRRRRGCSVARKGTVAGNEAVHTGKDSVLPAMLTYSSIDTGGVTSPSSSLIQNRPRRCSGTPASTSASTSL